jgi:Cu/Ag efflux pump CusA
LENQTRDAEGTIREVEAEGSVARLEARLDAARQRRRAIEAALSTKGSEIQAAQTARNEILGLSGLVLLAVCMLLYVAIGSWRLLTLVLANLPFARVGGVAAVLLTGGMVSIGAMVGFVTLFGISIRNSVMLVSHYQRLVLEDGEPCNSATAIRGALERLGPMLMTASVTALGLLPIALGGEGVGREIEQPMALVILGGLVTSTLLNLLVLPTLVRRFGHLDRGPAAELGEDASPGLGRPGA